MHLDVKHNGNLDSSQRRRMVFDENSTAKLQGLFMDLYSNKPLAIIREISTNARDSHIMAGWGDRPILITLPTALNPTFIVKDTGVGLTGDEIWACFNYGYSDKTDSDEVVGMMGLGLKSPLTYSSQFTLIGVKGGVKTTVLITREEDGGGSTQVIDTCATDEPNGVEVHIPVQSFPTFNDECHKFFRFWPHGSVLLDGEPIPKEDVIGCHPNDTVLEQDAVVLTKRVRSDTIVMGGVPYPVYADLIEHRKDPNVHAVVFVPIGAVKPVPSREALEKNKRYYDTVSEARTFITTAYQRIAQAEIDACPTSVEALKVTMRWREAFGGTFYYRGVDVPKQFYCDKTQTLGWNPRSEGNKSTQTHSVRILDAINALHVVGHHGKSLTQVAKDKLCKWMEDNGFNRQPDGGRYGSADKVLDFSEVPYVYLSPTPISASWLDDIKSVTWDEIKAIDLGDDAPVRKKRKKFRWIGDTGFDREADDMPADGRAVVWIEAGSQINRDVHLRQEIGKTVWDTGGRLFVIPKVSQPKWLKANPQAVTLEAWVTSKITSMATAFTPYDSLVMESGYAADYHKLEKLFRIGGIPDPELRRILRAFASASRVREGSLPVDDPRRGWQSLRRVARHLNVTVPKMTSALVALHDLSWVQREYPLLSSLGYHPNEGAVLDYLNLVYMRRSQLNLNPRTY